MWLVEAYHSVAGKLAMHDFEVVRNCAHTYVHALVRTCIHTCIHTYVARWVCLYVCTYVCMYVSSLVSSGVCGVYYSFLPQLYIAPDNLKMRLMCLGLASIAEAYPI